jgi:carboxymethylenebutenolidase
MQKLNADQTYFVEEFYDDYRQGLMSRREFIKRLAFVTGSMAATVATMGLMGCAADELPDPTEPMPTPVPPTAQAGENGSAAATPTASPPLVPVPGAQSPLSVPEGDPSVWAEEITYDSNGDPITAYLARPAIADAINPAIMVCHENRGLTPHIKDVARRLAQAGYVAIAPDLLSREGGTANLDPAQIPGLLGAAGNIRHVNDFLAAYAHLQTFDFVDGRRVGMTGFCFGGGITWDVATQLPDLRAAVPFYGRAPELTQIPNIQASVMVVYAELDSRITGGRETVEAALQEAGTTYQINVYPGVDHAFHNDTGSRYDETQATQAWQDTLGWFAAYV